jgi:nucleoid DNA-binding protein
MTATQTVTRSTDQPLRLDHVDLYYSYFGITIKDAKAESGWLALMPDGVLRFYEGRRPDLSRPPHFSAPGVGSLQFKRFLLRIRFAEVRRIAIFTGRSDPKAEGVDRAGEWIEQAGKLFDSPLLEMAGLATQGGGMSWEALTNSGGKQRRTAAKEFWRAIADGASAPTATKTVKAAKAAPRSTSPHPKAASKAPRTRPTAEPKRARVAQTAEAQTFIAALAEEMGTSPQEASAAVAAVFDTITDALASGEDVVLPRFGAFRPVVRNGRGRVDFRGYGAFRTAVAMGE